MIMPRRFWISGTAIFGLAIVLLIFSAGSWATDTTTAVQASQEIEIAVDKSYVLPIPKTVRESDHIRIAIAAPDIADFLFIPKINRKNRVRDIYIKGLKPGVTNLTLWKNGQIFRIYDIAVTFNISMLKRRLHEILPDEEEIRIFSTKDSITLSGTVSSASSLNQVLVLAEAYAGEGNIVNLLNVSGGQQVMLEVRVSEMDKRVSKRLGINFSVVNTAGEFGVSLLGGLSGFLIDGGVSASDSATGLLRLISPGGNVTYTGIIDFLKKNGLVKILAEPNLIALSGQTAHFLAGGEFPIPSLDQVGNVGVTFKPYGVELAFTPTVLSKDRISIMVEPVVSELDFNVSTSIGGSTVPGILARRVSTMVEMADGQSFAIAGMLQDTARENVDKYPVLGDIPILGALFSSKQWQRQETELVIIVTPHIVKPLNMAEQTLPTDFYIEPDDAEFYLWGIFGKSHETAGIGEAELDGEFGHIFEKNE
ncbi:MAG: type II and III secretion system protein family protein [Deltaproteobacteria bacterium]|nr:type II and III secretion system protein family protein [Deltaproteobacteria bacterium]